MELCLGHARERRNMSVDRVADAMGLASRFTLYKWLESGRMPAVLIHPFELACGATFVTSYLAASAHKLLIDMPTGRAVDGDDIAGLHGSFASAVEALAGFYGGRSDAPATLGRLLELMQTVAWHHGNVERHSQPQLDFEVSPDE
ncbi:hypothetical protein BDD21_1898 [Thiocapsa rosea]|uniref:Uncharacterized protein n=2 Tax=Thiocapsa rosea TaxID=69360 RepID=A0A495V7B8_9GAMM|nr:hypothetical protein BDD21_1898 [Thiocapsa rosea]